MTKSTHLGRVVIVTGGGGGLGRAYALLHAELGARVVVNDLGGAPDGVGANTSVADAVVEQITDAGGTAVPDYNAVDTFDGASNLIRTAVDAFGTIDAVINNAGILRDVSMKNMEPEQFDAVVKVHTYGAWNVAKAAWRHLLESATGRIVNTTSGAGLYGGFGQVNYSAAKSALVGMTRSFAAEGAKYGLKANVVAPLAWSRLTAEILPPELESKLRPEAVAPLVAYLTSPECQDSGRIFAAGGGHLSRVATYESRGVELGLDHTVDDVADAWKTVCDMSSKVEVVDGQGHAANIVGELMN